MIAPALRSFLGWFFHSYRIAPSDLGKAIICKLIRDLPPSTSDLFYYVLFLLLGGDWKSSPTRNVDLLFYNLSGMCLLYFKCRVCVGIITTDTVFVIYERYE